LGVPRSINIQGISDVQLRKLAGNSMALPVLEALFTLLMGSVDFSKPMSKHAPLAVHDCDVISVDQGYHIATPNACSHEVRCPWARTPENQHTDDHLDAMGRPREAAERMGGRARTRTSQQYQ